MNFEPKNILKSFYKDLSSEDKKQIQSLSLRKRSGFLDRKRKNKNPYMMCYKEEGLILGWVAIFDRYEEAILNFYIRKKARGQGLARKLFLQALDSQIVRSKIRVSFTSWDYGSFHFFKRMLPFIQKTWRKEIYWNDKYFFIVYSAKFNNLDKCENFYALHKSAPSRLKKKV